MLILGACARSEPAPDPIRLADTRHAGEGAAQVATAVVGEVRRPVLSPWRRSLLKRVLVPAESVRALQLEMPLPERMRAGRLRLDAQVTYLKGKVPDRVHPLIEEAGRVLGQKAEEPAGVEPAVIERPGPSLTVTVSAPPRSTQVDVLVEVFARPLEEEWTTEPILIPPHAALHFGIGIDPIDPVVDLSTTEAKISVLDGDDPQILFARSFSDPGFDRDRWHDEQIDLAPYAGRTVRLRFTTRTTASTNQPVVLWSDPTIVARTRRDVPRVNLVLISLDTLRADHLGSYGYARPTSPTSDARIATQGTLFERVSTSFPHTVGSHMTLFTGVDPCVHGLDQTAWKDTRRVRDHVTTLAEALRAAGYETAAFTENAWVTAQIGFDRGFATFVEDSGVGFNNGNVEVTFRRGAEWLATHGREPFFLFLHTYQVHEPYEPPPGYVEQVASGHGTDRVAQENALYDGEIRYTDDVLARLLAALEQSGLEGNTLLVVTADHGQHFGEHRTFGHSTTLYEPVLHVPLILRGPGIPAGLRIPDPVGLIDVAPTVLELLGVPAPKDIQGRSLVPALHGEALPPRDTYAELPERGLLAVRRGSLKLILAQKSDAKFAFDLAADPGEEVDIASRLPATLWQQIADDHREHCRHDAPMPSSDEPAPASIVNGQVRQKLEALGYAE